MKKFFQSIFQRRVKNNVSVESIREKHTCALHNNNKYPNIKANEYCHTCMTSMCYMCGMKHVDNYCAYSWGQNLIKHDHSSAIVNEKLIFFNKGYVAIADIHNMRCPCGNLLHDHDTSAFCAACATATCSSKCHDHFMVKQNSCVFHKNFTIPMEENTGLRSITWKNIKYLQKSGMAIGTPVSLTSSRFLYAVLGPNPGIIYLQRGYRQYGDPHDNTLQSLQINGRRNLDFVVFQHRKCDCTCRGCKERSIHPALNCYYECENSDIMILEDVKHDERMFETCGCRCEFCTSGLYTLKHSKIQWYCCSLALHLLSSYYQ